MLGLRGEVLKLAPSGLKQSHFLIPASLRSSAHTQGRGEDGPSLRSAPNGSLRFAWDWIPACAGMTRVM